MKNIILKIASAAFLGMLIGCATIMGQSAAETLNVRSSCYALSLNTATDH